MRDEAYITTHKSQAENERVAHKRYSPGHPWPPVVVPPSHLDKTQAMFSSHTAHTRPYQDQDFTIVDCGGLSVKRDSGCLMTSLNTSYRGSYIPPLLGSTTIPSTSIPYLWEGMRQ